MTNTDTADIDATVKQRFFKFLCENTLSADYRKRIGFHITRGLDDFNANLD